MLVPFDCYSIEDIEIWVRSSAKTIPLYVPTCHTSINYLPDNFHNCSLLILDHWVSHRYCHCLAQPHVSARWAG